MQVAPKAIPSTLTTSNAHSADVAHHNLFAYAAKTVIVVVHVSSLEIVQSLDANPYSPHDIVKLKWGTAPLSDSLDDPFYLKLASADTRGALTVWNVGDGLPMVHFSQGRPLVDLLWLSSTALLALETGGRLVCYDTVASLRSWAYTLPEPMNALAVNPFDPDTILVSSSSGWVYSLSSTSPSSPPTSVTRKYRVSHTPHSSSSSSSFPSSSSPVPIPRASTTTPSILSHSTASAASRSQARIRAASPSSPPTGTRVTKFAAFRSAGSPPSSLSMSRARSPPLSTSPSSSSFASSPPSSYLSPFSSSSSSSSNPQGPVLGGGELIDVLFAPTYPSIVMFVLQYEVLFFDLKLEQTAWAISLDPKRVAPLTSVLLPEGEPTLLYTVHQDGTIVVRSSPPHSLKFDPAYVSTALRKLSPAGGLLGHVYSTLLCPLDPRILMCVTSSGSVIKLALTPGPDNPKLYLAGALEPVASKAQVFAVQPSSHVAAVGCASGLVQIIDLQSGEVSASFSVFDTPVKGLAWSKSEASFLAFTHDGITSRQPPHDILSSSGSGDFANSLVALDTTSGAVRTLRSGIAREFAHATALSVSSSGKYYALLLGSPLDSLEIWSISPDTALRSIVGHGTISALSWSPSTFVCTQAMLVPAETNLLASASTQDMAEQIIFASAAAGLVRFHVVDNVVHPGARIALNVHASATVTCLTWAGPLLVAGTTFGDLHVLDLQANALSKPAQLREPIANVVFGGGSGEDTADVPPRVLVRFHSGAFGLWDPETRQALNSSSKSSGLHVLASALSWVGHAPVALGQDGILRVLDPTLSRSSTHMASRIANQSCTALIRPFLLPHHIALGIRSRLHHGLCHPDPGMLAPPQLSLRNRTLDRFRETSTGLDAAQAALPEDLIAQIVAAPSLPKRAILAASFFGDASASRFWSLVDHYMEKAIAAAPPTSTAHDPVALPLQEIGSGGDMIQITPPQFEGEDVQPPAHQPPAQEETPLSPVHDLLQDRGAVVDWNSALLAMHTKARNTEDPGLTQALVHSHIQLGEYPDAVRLLLGTPGEDPDHASDALMACLVSAVVSPDMFLSTVKLVATDLIASGHIQKGVQLLCLAGKRSDACRYLQSYGHWEDASWLAKVGLSDQASHPVFRSWASHLADVGDIETAISVCISILDWHAALQLLYNAKHYARAALLARTCVDVGLLSPQDAPEDTDPSLGLLPLKPLLDAIYLEYGMWLYHVGEMVLAESYLLRAGQSGEHMLECLVQSLPEA